MKKIKINDITIRDIFQNIDAGFINAKLLGRIIDHISKVKFESLEIFGGSAFEKILENRFFANPFEVVHRIKSSSPKLLLGALIGARNLVGMEVYPKTVIKKFIKQGIKSGIDRFRVYDALNDIENFRFIISEIKDSESSCQGVIIYDDMQNNDYYVKTSEKLIDFGCESICIKDVESTLLPHRSQELFKDLTSSLNTRFYLSAYNLRGLQVSNYYSACINGCNGVDMSLIPSSYNDLSPAIFPFILSFKDTENIVEADYLKVLELFEWFKQNIYPMVKNEMLLAGFIFSNKNRNLLPKWLLTSINNQLNEIGESSKIDLVLDEVFKIKNEIGNPSLSTPVGQIIGSQAILNSIISDYRWEITNDEIKKLISGYYGSLPRNIDEKIALKIIGENNFEVSSQSDIEETSRTDTADSDSGKNSMDDDKTFEQCASEIKSLSEKDSDILSYMFFPEKTYVKLESAYAAEPEYANGKSLPQDVRELKFPEFFDSKQQARFDEIDLKKIKEITDLVETSNIDEIKLEIEGVKISINKHPKTRKEASPGQYKTAADEPSGEPVAANLGTGRVLNETAGSAGIIEVKSPIVGTFYSSPSPGAPPFVQAGSKIKKGDTLCIIEAMKLMNKINSDYDGIVQEITVNNEDAVEYDQVIMRIKV